ncbi:response regulator [Owenweeksia hongkongensis]|uniref:response regulator n=1 Tax=Owenweeksia hongkongensis TaxID=253245 RepID=UPI003A95DC07
MNQGNSQHKLDVSEKLLILLVDDNDALNFLHKKLCAINLPDAEVISFENGRLALDYLNRNSKFLEKQEVLILLDIRMPVMDGWSFLKEIVGGGLSAQHSIVMLTSSTSKLDREKAMSYPFVMGYLEKPLRGFQLQELADALNKVHSN